MPKCAKCKRNLNRIEAHVVETTSEKTGRVTKKYYCSEEEYNTMIKERENRDATYKEILKYFPSIKMVKDLPKVFFMEMAGIADVHGWDCILNYLHDNEDFLHDILKKDFVSCNAKANYLYKVILNRIDCVKKVEVRSTIIKQSEEAFIITPHTSKKHTDTRKGFDDLLEDL